MPQTARSGSSHGTPRNGTFTARSGGEKGTPRDAQRLALGERPRDEGWSGDPRISPQHTARSAALSSEPWSAGLSSRTGSSSWEVGCEDGGQHAGEPHQPRGSSDCVGAEYHLDLQKSLEVMRFVIMKENQKLKDFIQQTRDAISEMGEQLEEKTDRAITDSAVSAGAAAAGMAADAVDSACHSPKRASSDKCSDACHVEWCIQNVGEVLSQSHSSSDYCERTKFRRLGREFELRFYPLASTGNAATQGDAANAAPARHYEAVLDAWVAADRVSSSSDAAALSDSDLRVTLSVIMESGPEWEQSEVTAEAVLQGTGHVICRGAWPLSIAGCSAGVPDNVVCRVHVEELCGWGPGRLHLRSSWRPPST